MEMKIGRTIQSTYTKEKNHISQINVDTNSEKAKNTNSSTKIDTFSLSPAALLGKSISASSNVYTNSTAARSTNADISMREQLRMFSENIKNAKALNPITRTFAPDDFAGRTEFYFEIIRYSERKTNEAISQRLEEAGVPKDVTFEFDWNYDSGTFEITKISDETYRESVEKVLESCRSLTTISFASRVMNGYKSSILYPSVSNALKSSFGQDINDLYIDENGNLGGVNKNLQAAINAEKRSKETGEYFHADFFWDNIEELLKRLVSENITPNISHMGYDGECIYTNDGEFKFGKDFDPNLFNEEKYIMRGTQAFFMTAYNTYLWLKYYEKFY